MSYLGIRGFDAVLRGGVPRRAAVLLLVPEGEERAILGCLWVREGLNRGERALAVLGRESPDAFLARLGRMGVDAEAALASGALSVVDWHSAWNGAEGASGGGIVRVPKDAAGLLAAVERLVSEKPAATTRRAFVDVRSRAIAHLGEEETAKLVRGLREVLSKQGVTSIFTARRDLPEPQVAALEGEFHAILDARLAEEGVLEFAVLSVGGVRLTPRHRRVRVREDGAAVLGARTLRTFSCPICGARVPLDAAMCPSCRTARSEMTAQAAKEGLMDYLEALGRPAGKGEGKVVPSPPAGPRPPGFTNGVRPPAGRVNGVAPAGRTNGLRAPDGRTNGMVNGLRRARAGLTNGLTNGSGFTNGLGGPKARFEAGHARWKVYLVPLLAVALLVSPFVFPSSEVPNLPADGKFDEWTGVAGYDQTAPPGVNLAIALHEYKILRDLGTIRLYASVHGEWFDSPTEVQAFYAFLDTDANRDSGYRVRDLGAEYLLIVEGSAGEVTLASVRSFLDNGDPHNWTAWRMESRAFAAVAPSGPKKELEAVFTLAVLDDPGAPDPVVLLVTDDMRGGRTLSSVSFRPGLGAVRARLRAVNSTVPTTPSDVLAVDLEAVGTSITVTGLDVGISSGVATPIGLPITLNADESATVAVRVDASALSAGTILTADLRGVTTSAGHRATLLGGPARIYVQDGPAGKFVDGWFDDWDPSEKTLDGDPGSVDPDRNLNEIAANRTGTTLYLYGDVKGQFFAGWATPVKRVKPVAGGEPGPSPPVVPARRAGEDILRVYVDVDANAPDGVATHGLRGADLLLEVRGVQGQVTKRTAYEWRNGWKSMPPPRVEHDEQRLEASLPVPAAGVVEVVFETAGWGGPADVTEVSGTRGVRPDGEGSFRYEGPFLATFQASGRVAFAAGDVEFAWTLPPVRTAGDGADPSTWDLEPSPVGVTYRAEGVEVRYVTSRIGVKEEYVLLRPPEGPLSLEFALEIGDRAMVWREDVGPISILGSSGHAFQIGQPFAVDARGVVTDLAAELDLEARVYRIPVPEAVLGGAYPIAIDPPVTYTLRNDGPAYKKGEQLGYSVAVGDFNGDGYADVLTGAPFNSRAGTNVGYAYVFYGPLTSNKTAPDVRLNGTGPVQGRFGLSVAAGKFNSDQYWDALVARVSLQGSAIGNVSIYYGSSGWSGEVTSEDVKFTAPGSPQNFGWTVAAGNVDNKNYDDVLVGEPGRDNDGGLLSQDGVVYLYMSPFSSVVNSANFTLFPSANASGQLGRGGLSVGKIDSDAYPDVVVGEPIFSSSEGRLQFYKGISFASGSGNRYPNATIGAPSGGGNTGQFGFAVSVGRLDSDGYADLLVSAPFKFTNNGRVFVYLANSDGSGLSSGASASVTLASQSSAERYGTSVQVADFDDDGTGDVAVGAPTAAGGGTNRGRVYWYRRPLTNQTPTETVTGSQNDERLGQSLATGRFSNDARTKLAIGAYLWDKNPSNTTDNDGRVVVADVPEPAYAMLGLALLLPPVTREWRRRRSRDRPGGYGRVK